MTAHTRLIVDAITAYLDRPARRPQPMTYEALNDARSSAANKAAHLGDAEFKTAFGEADQALPDIPDGGITRGGYADLIRQTVGGTA